MTSSTTPRTTRSADDGVPSPDDVPPASDEKEGKDDKPPSSAPFMIIGAPDAEACGLDGC